MKELHKFAYWIKEREKVRMLKEAGRSRPWSLDPVFQTVYFCNVHREDDKTTKWIRKHWNFPEHPNYELAICLARLINRIETLAALLPPNSEGWSIGKAVDQIRYIANEGNVVWGGAYVVTTHGRRISKLDYLEEVLSDMAPDVHEVRNKKTLSLAHHFLMQYEGFGSFMAAQIVADLKNTEGHPLSFAEDWWGWSAYGPGSLRGLQWVYGHSISIGKYEEAIKDLHPVVEELVYPIHMCEQDLQNCLCEFDKYCRVLNRKGRSKRIYHGKGQE